MYQEDDDVAILKPYQGEENKPKVTKEDLFPDNRGFLLRNVLTKAECQFYIEQAEQLGMIHVKEDGYYPGYRDNVRVIVSSRKIASEVFDRIKPFVAPIILDKSNQKHYYGCSDGKWLPSKLNDRFRICKYFPGGHFSPHYDGEFMETHLERSMKTFMIYLNDQDEFGGGETNFLKEPRVYVEDPVTGKMTAPKDSILFRIKPEAGMVLVFDHRILHEGSTVENGMKYIMRTDVVYKKEF